MLVVAAAAACIIATYCWLLHIDAVAWVTVGRPACKKHCFTTIPRTSLLENRSTLD